jgi:hypothetical protein
VTSRSIREEESGAGQDLHSKLIVLLPEILVKTRGHKRETLATLLAHNDEPEVLQICTEVIRRARQVEHDTPVAPLSEADKLVVLSNDLTSAAREVEREGRLVRTQVVDVEDEFLREVLGIAPHNPAHTGVNKTVLMPVLS